MKRLRIDRSTLIEFFQQLDTAFAYPGDVYLVGETTQVFEGMREWTTQIEFTADIAPGQREMFTRAANGIANKLGVSVLEESPADLIPLPEGFEQRAREPGDPAHDVATQHITIKHFDPYSVSFRFIARGDEPDYTMVLTFLENRWVEFARMNEMLETLLPAFNMETIQQDSAEFKRRYKGLAQKWRSTRPLATHRTTAV